MNKNLIFYLKVIQHNLSKKDCIAKIGVKPLYIGKLKLKDVYFQYEHFLIPPLLLLVKIVLLSLFLW